MGVTFPLLVLQSKSAQGCRREPTEHKQDLGLGKLAAALEIIGREKEAAIENVVPQRWKQSFVGENKGFSNAIDKKTCRKPMKNRVADVLTSESRSRGRAGKQNQDIFETENVDFLLVFIVKDENPD